MPDEKKARIAALMDAHLAWEELEAALDRAHELGLDLEIRDFTEIPAELQREYGRLFMPYREDK